ncbi:MAG TPA: hypothetical protein VE219_03655, partial [Candidatus Sulfotelmatobacter sp.]|nr:hypothetical protein [Candidatus Sulfotelmatobacter sp.]
AGATLLANLGMHIGAEEIEDQAARLGSDVPALLHGGASFVEGRGDRLRAIDCPALCGAIAVLDTSSTARVFAELQPAELRSQGNVDSGDRCALVIRRLTSGEAPDPADLGSSLEAAARRVNPRLDRNLEALRACSQSVSWHMTGSGGAVFALAQSWAAAEAAARLAREAGFPARAWRTTAAPLFGW